MAERCEGVMGVNKKIWFVAWRMHEVMRAGCDSSRRGRAGSSTRIVAMSAAGVTLSATHDMHATPCATVLTWLGGHHEHFEDRTHLA